LQGQDAAFEGGALVVEARDVFDLDELQPIAGGRFAHLVLTDQARGPVQTVAGAVVEEVEGSGVIGESVPVDFVLDGRAADFGDFGDRPGRVVSFNSAILRRSGSPTDFVLQKRNARKSGKSTPEKCELPPGVNVR
jgi:hypothetical protein